jgi:stage II sporulation protein D (peptidoglycan lytic transglycosylase)
VLLLLAAAGNQSSALQRAADAAPAELRIGFARPGGGYTIQTIPLETYIARVLAGEAARDSPPAALEALAITIRTFTLFNRDRHRADGFDLCDETHCQVVRTATAATTRAAQATAGQVLTFNGNVAEVFYSASCGGRTEIPSNVWPKAEDWPYLPSADDDACEGAPAWEASLSESDLLRAFRAAGFRGERLRNVRIQSRNSSERVARLALDGLEPPEISGQDLRVVVGRTLGWQHIKSAAFELRKEGSSYRFTGHGYGHGVGMCVIGSTNLAARGVNASMILARYFPGAAITALGARIPDEVVRVEPSVPTSPPPPPMPADILVTLPSDDEGDRAAIARSARAARDELAGMLGVPAPARMSIRFHTTTEEYEQATGQSWFTSGTWAKGEIHLMPLIVLRSGDLIERTLRRALVHAMTDELLGNRPAWVRDGAALFFADGGAASDVKGRCPQDNELRYPVSAGALANAYARARSCFARQIEAGKIWNDVR